MNLIKPVVIAAVCASIVQGIVLIDRYVSTPIDCYQKMDEVVKEFTDNGCTNPFNAPHPTAGGGVGAFFVFQCRDTAHAIEMSPAEDDKQRELLLGHGFKPYGQCVLEGKPMSMFHDEKKRNVEEELKRSEVI